MRTTCARHAPPIRHRVRRGACGAQTPNAQAHPGGMLYTHARSATHTRTYDIIRHERRSATKFLGRGLAQSNLCKVIGSSRRVGPWSLACVHSRGPFECSRASAAPLTQESPRARATSRTTNHVSADYLALPIGLPLVTSWMALATKARLPLLRPGREMRPSRVR